MNGSKATAPEPRPRYDAALAALGSPNPSDLSALLGISEKSARNWAEGNGPSEAHLQHMELLAGLRAPLRAMETPPEASAEKLHPTAAQALDRLCAYSHLSPFQVQEAFLLQASINFRTGYGVAPTWEALKRARRSTGLGL